MSTEPLDLSHRHWGSGQPLILIHGLFGSSINWQTLAQRLAQEWSVYAVDLRNHGDSPHHPDFDYAALVQDLESFMTRQKIEKGILIGHSLGGKTAMAFADRWPQKTEALIVLDIAPRPYPAAHRELLEALWNLPADRIGSRQEALDALATQIPMPATRQFLLKNLVRVDGRYRWRINLEAIDRHMEALSQGPRLTRPYPGPTLFLRGGRSGYITEADADLIHERYPDARIVTIESAGHWLYADAPEETLAAICGHLRDRINR
jgi:pimeloyl-ACP methyl ester carboxylesterase